MARKNKITHVEFFSARDTMKANGWKHTLSVNERNSDDKYGSLWVKDGREFWMNDRTMGNIPTD